MVSLLCSEMEKAKVTLVECLLLEVSNSGIGCYGDDVREVGICGDLSCEVWPGYAHLSNVMPCVLPVEWKEKELTQLSLPSFFPLGFCSLS